MKTTTWRSLKLSLSALAAAAILAACGDGAPLGPDPSIAPSAQRSILAAPDADVDTGKQTVDLTGCENLEVPAGNRFHLRLYAQGVQIYRWNGTSWSFVEPWAVLYADAGFRGAVGTHFAGPTWLSNSGSRVVGAVADRCNRDPDAIPWLLLRAVSTDGPGVFQKTTFIQRVNTVAGLAPADPGGFPGEIARVPYAAEYLYYRAH